MVSLAALVMPAMANNASAAPGDILFSDDFETGVTCDAIATTWTTTDVNLSGIGTQTANSNPCSLFTRGGAVIVTSPVIDLSGVVGADLEGWLRQGADAFSEDVDAGEDMVIEYRDAIGTWQTLENYLGSEPFGTVYAMDTALPLDALHANFQFRLRQLAGSGGPPANGGIGYDYWHIDDIILTETGTAPPAPPPSTLGVNTCDTFEGSFDNWVTTDSAASGINGDTFNSASNSMFLRYGNVTTTSTSFSSAGIDEMTVWVRRGADSFSENPDPNDDLFIEYLDSSLNWVELEEFLGGGTPGQIYNQTYALPLAAQHANFRVRFRYPFGSGSPYDYWHVDDVCFNGSEPDFDVVKSVVIEQDPINGTSNPLGIPGAWAVYSITVTNSGAGSADAGSLVIGDDIDGQTTLFTGNFDGSGSPFEFTDGAGVNSSGLSLIYTGLGSPTDGVVFRDGVGADMTPTGGFDPAVGSFELQFDGAMNGTSSGGTPTFTIEYRVLIE